MDGAPGTSPLMLMRHGEPLAGESLYVDASGAFSQMLQPGYYHICMKDKQYPFVLKDFVRDEEDTLAHIGLKIGSGRDDGISIGSRIDLTLVPFYLLDKFFAWYDSGMKAFRLMCTVKPNKDESLTKAVPSVKSIHIYLSPTAVVNSGTDCEWIEEAQIAEFSGPLFLSVPFSFYQTRYREPGAEAIYCRMALELDNIPDYYLFTNTVKINITPNN